MIIAGTTLYAKAGGYSNPLVGYGVIIMVVTIPLGYMGYAVSKLIRKE